MHAAVEALESKKAAIFGSALEVRTNKIPLCKCCTLLNATHLAEKGAWKCSVLAYHAVSVLEGLAALPSDIGSSV